MTTICHDNDGDGTYQFDHTFKNLATDTVYTETTAARWREATLTLAPGTNYKISTGATHMKHVISHAVLLDSQSATDIATIHTWMEAKYGVEDEEEASAAEAANFFAELDINTR